MRRWRLGAAGFGLALPLVGAGILAVSRVDAVACIERLTAAPVLSSPWGFVLVMVVQTLIAASGILPASLVGVAAGMVCGPAAGFLAAAACTMGGALATFLVMRWCSADVVQRLFRQRPGLQAFDALLARDGWRFVCLLRLSPVVPFAATSSLLGLSSISLSDYLLGTCASLPALLGYVLAGAFLKHLGFVWRDGLDRLPLILLGLGVAATIALTVRIGQLAARALASAETTDDILSAEGC